MGDIPVYERGSVPPRLSAPFVLAAALPALNGCGSLGRAGGLGLPMSEESADAIEIPPGRYVLDSTVLIGDPVSEEKFRATIALHHELSVGGKSLCEGLHGDSATDEATATTAD
jgi:hypothetical protein